MDSIGDSPDISDWIYEREEEEKEKKRLEAFATDFSISILHRKRREKLATILKDMSDEDIVFVYKEISSNMCKNWKGDFSEIRNESGYLISDDERVVRIARNKPEKEYTELNFKYLDKYKQSTLFVYDKYHVIDYIYLYSPIYVYVNAGGYRHKMFKVPTIDNINELSADEIILLLNDYKEINVI